MTVTITVQSWLLGLLALLLCGAGTAPGQVCANEVYPQLPQEERAAAVRPEPLVCVVVRTYYGHGDSSEAGLRHLIHSLQRQTASACALV